MIYHRVSNYINTTGNTNGAETSYPSRVTEFTPGSCYSVFSGVRVTRSLVLGVMFCRSLFVLLSFFFWPLCCLSFDLRIPITPLVSSNVFLQQSSWILFITDFSNMFIKKDETAKRYCPKLSFIKKCFDTIHLGRISQI